VELKVRSRDQDFSKFSAIKIKPTMRLSLSRVRAKNKGGGKSAGSQEIAEFDRHDCKLVRLRRPECLGPTAGHAGRSVMTVRSSESGFNGSLSGLWTLIVARPERSAIVGSAHGSRKPKLSLSGDECHRTSKTVKRTA
jgi:hypothetical protein